MIAFQCLDHFLSEAQSPTSNETQTAHATIAKLRTNICECPEAVAAVPRIMGVVPCPEIFLNGPRMKELWKIAL
jgi:hypothetical protein